MQMSNKQTFLFIVLAALITLSGSALAHSGKHSRYNDHYYHDRYDDYDHRYYRDHHYDDRRYSKKRHYQKRRYHDNRWHGYEYSDHHDRSRDYKHRKPDGLPYFKGSDCVPYKITSYGGVGGFRTMDDIKNFKRVNGSVKTGKLCGNRNVTVEISKMNPATTTVFTLGNRNYVFQAHEPADKVINNWHRKYISINLNHYKPRTYY